MTGYGDRGDGTGLLTIGAFARACRLSPKALRLYDDLGLLPPAHVDPQNGYRRYAPAQLERARLVAWLRRLGMPLARIREVCALPPGTAATVVAAYWERVEADTAARRDLAVFLVDQLSRKDSTMATTPTPVTLRAAALTDGGLVRTANQDAVHAGRRLLAVADGYGTTGGRAAATALGELTALETRDLAPADLLDTLEEAAHRANGAVRRLGAEGASEAGCTLTALLHAGARLALAHIGDSRGYVLRDARLVRLTHDHSLVQSLIDEGRLTPEEAPGHPQRALLSRALDGGEGFAPDLRLLDARPGERYLLCTDGLHAVLPPGTLQEALTAAPGPEQAVRELVTLAREAGAPDNIGCVVADTVAADA